MKHILDQQNISKNSKNNLDEVGIISDHPAIMASAIQLIDDLAEQSTVIDKMFIERASKIEVKKGSDSLFKTKNQKNQNK